MSKDPREDNIQVRRRTLLLSAIAVLVGGVLVGALTILITGAPFGFRGTVPLLVTNASPLPSGEMSFSNGFAPVVERVRPAVANVSSTKIIRSVEGGPMAPFFADPFLRQFFGEGFWPQFKVPREQRERSLGSGVVVSPDGYLLTNNHVVEGAKEIEIYLSDQRQLKAKIIGTDRKTDVAVVKVDAKNLPVLVVGDSSRVRVGDFVLAAGDPFGIGQTFTMGIVSATGRGGLGIEEYEDFIQTDAAINPGNSGGALVNVRGELIGINTAIISGSGGGNQGIGFAVPMNMARQVMDQILKHGKVIRGWLGVVVQPVTPAMAKAFGLKEPRGALIGDVTPNSPAAQGGLLRGDVVLELDGKPIADSRDLSLKIAESSPGMVVKMKIIRNTAERELSVRLGEMPAQAARGGEEGGGEGGALQGLSVDELAPQIARQLGLPARTKGVVITEVQPGSLAGEAGLRSGDVIQEVNHRQVSSVAEFEGAVREAGNQPLLLLINRRGNTLFIVVEHH